MTLYTVAVNSFAICGDSGGGGFESDVRHISTCMNMPHYTYANTLHIISQSHALYRPGVDLIRKMKS